MLDTWVIVGASVAYLGLAVRDRLLRGQARRCGPLGHPRALTSMPVDGRCMRRPGPSTDRSAAPRARDCAFCRSTSVRLSPCSGGAAAQDGAHPHASHHVDRRLHRQRATARAARWRLVTVIALIGILPYIPLQLKAVANSLTILRASPDNIHGGRGEADVLEDTTLGSRWSSPASHRIRHPPLDATDTTRHGRGDRL